MNTILVGLIVMGVVICAIIYIISLFRKPVNKYENIPVAVVKQERVEQRPTIVLYHADWCPHCVRMRPEWQKMAEALRGKVVVKEVESKNPEIGKHNIKGFPTIRLYPTGGDDYIEYKGERTADKLENFAMSGSESALI